MLSNLKNLRNLKGFKFVGYVFFNGCEYLCINKTKDNLISIQSLAKLKNYNCVSSKDLDSYITDFELYDCVVLPVFRLKALKGTILKAFEVSTLKKIDYFLGVREKLISALNELEILKDKNQTLYLNDILFEEEIEAISELYWDKRDEKTLSVECFNRFSQNLKSARESYRIPSIVYNINMIYSIADDISYILNTIYDIKAL